MEMMDRGCVSSCCRAKWLLQCCVWHKGGCSSSVECRQWGAEISKCYQLPNLPFSTLSWRRLSFLHSCCWQQDTGNTLLRRFVCTESLHSLFLPFTETWHQILPPPAPQPLPSLQRCWANLTNLMQILALAVWPALVLGAGFCHIQARQVPRAVLWHSQVTWCHTEALSVLVRPTEQSARRSISAAGDTSYSTEHALISSYHLSEHHFSRETGGYPMQEGSPPLSK